MDALLMPEQMVTSCLSSGDRSDVILETKATCFPPSCPYGARVVLQLLYSAPGGS